MDSLFDGFSLCHAIKTSEGIRGRRGRRPIIFVSAVKPDRRLPVRVQGRGAGPDRTRRLHRQTGRAGGPSGPDRKVPGQVAARRSPRTKGPGHDGERSSDPDHRRRRSHAGFLLPDLGPEPLARGDGRGRGLRPGEDPGPSTRCGHRRPQDAGDQRVRGPRKSGRASIPGSWPSSSPATRPSTRPWRP